MKDLLLDENFDITNQIGEATDQTTEIVVMSHKGSFKQYPSIGVNALDFMKGEVRLNALESKIKLELAVDGAQITAADFRNLPFKIEARWQS
ncbi:hypothetical protein [Microscilla marina]|uniref:Uncharacterized protein n=1 Tax=Microscilla marina ATCC 23134 TaxID=313606 RepID=A1ZLI3_MICM2|nr:hypothetical protein [Microscilla marina]EAY28737.1 hypothetical protein M23134_07835 [Microscilla marina ATCC 23134]